MGPFESECGLAQHPAVAECGAIGAPDDIRGEVIEAYIVLRDGHPVRLGCRVRRAECCRIREGTRRRSGRRRADRRDQAGTVVRADSVMWPPEGQGFPLSTCLPTGET
ncbi:hypothetical protein [Streptomyces sp. NPDC005423]|uniref:AMP-binding enzyme n=1 Tax=Streptomyces sp. NPDC005423 TaxID=3155343 RepID=UPI0033AC0D6B